MANQLQDTQTLLVDLEDLRDELYPLARRAAMLFAILRSLQSIHNEYQFSLKYFLELFDEAIGGEPLAPEEEDGVRMHLFDFIGGVDMNNEGRPKGKPFSS